jgi:hypothetical protein
MPTRRFVLVLPVLACLLLGSTCIVIEEEPAHGSYADESQEEALMEEMNDETVREIER